MADRKLCWFLKKPFLGRLGGETCFASFIFKMDPGTTCASHGHSVVPNIR